MKKKIKTEKRVDTNKPIISDEVKSYANDPFFVKKTASAKAYLEKVGFPEDFIRKKP